MYQSAYLQRLRAARGSGTGKWRVRLALLAVLCICAYVVYSFAPAPREAGTKLLALAGRSGTRARLRRGAGTGPAVKMAQPGSVAYAGNAGENEGTEVEAMELAGCDQEEENCPTGETVEAAALEEAAKTDSEGGSSSGAGSEEEDGGGDKDEGDGGPEGGAVEGEAAAAPTPTASPAAPTPSTTPPAPSPSAASTPSAAPPPPPKEVPPVVRTAGDGPVAMVAAVQDFPDLFNPEWAQPQRPTQDGEERALTSHKFQELNVASINPPPALSTYPAAVAAELASRLVIVMGCGVHSGHTNVAGKGYISLPLFNTMVPSFLPTAQPWHIYRFYLAYDHNDPIYESAEHRAKIEEEFYRQVKEENAKRWHPTGWTEGTIDASTLVVTLHWVHCNYAGKPAWAHSDAIMAGYKEGGDYGFRTNDDTEFPKAKDWVDRFVMDLRGRRPVPNLGIVGPACAEGANWILTHDFTHRTHALVFGFQYPRTLPDWSSDDWITYMYKFYGIMSRREDIPVVHKLHGTRYNPMHREARLDALNKALVDGAASIDAFTQANYGVTLPHHLETITCC